MQRDDLEELARSLPVPRWRRGSIVRELRSHVEETHTDLVIAGWPPEEAAREARSRLGDTQEIAASFADVYRPSRSARVGLALALAGGMLLGVFGVSGTLASSPSSHHAPVAPTVVLHAHPVQRPKH